MQTFLASIPAPAQAPAPASAKAPAPINWPVVLAVSLGGLLALSGILLQLRPKPAQI